MNKSVVKYMAIDLIVLTLIGCLLEGLVARFIGFVLHAAPTISFSLLIVFVAVARWKLWGLIPIPFLVLSTIIGGQFSEITYYAAFYNFSNWQLILSMLLGLSTIGLNVIVFRNHKTNKIMKTTWQMLLILVVDYILYCGVQFIFYRIFTTGGLTSLANIPVTYFSKDENGNRVELVKNLASSVEFGFVYNLFGLAVGVVGSLVLRSQGALNNAIDKLIDDKKQREAELEYMKSFGKFNFSDESEAESQQDESNIKKEDQDSSM
jgi:hypothetical protein